MSLKDLSLGTVNLTVVHGRRLGECSSPSSVTAANTSRDEGAGPGVLSVFLRFIHRSHLESRGWKERRRQCEGNYNLIHLIWMPTANSEEPCEEGLEHSWHTQLFGTGAAHLSLFFTRRRISILGAPQVQIMAITHNKLFPQHQPAESATTQFQINQW